MANIAVPAGDNGVSGDISGDDDLYQAKRSSVAGTQYWPTGTYTRSGVYSLTHNLRFAYAGVECDTPASDRSA